MADKITSETIFNLQDRVAPLDIIALPGTEELGGKINAHLQEWACNSGREQDSFLIPVECPRFSSGDGKGMIKASIRGDDLFILVDVGNYSCTYNMFGRENSMSPDDHFQDLKRIIQAAGGKAHRINVIMPILYGGRQHRRSYRESLDCAVSLQELERMGVSNIITFDAHDARVQNAVPLMGFDNVIPAYQTLKALFHSFPDLIPDREHLMIVSPDEGAMHRNMYYASIMGLDLGMFYKRRDYARVVNGRNPIVAHEYLGDSVEGRDIFIADDIISSGESMLDIAYELKKRKAGRISPMPPIPSSQMGWMLLTRPMRKGSSPGCSAPISPTGPRLSAAGMVLRGGRFQIYRLFHRRIEPRRVCQPHHRSP